MPEPYWPKRKGSFTLADAARSNRLARIWCRYCKRSHNFEIADLKTVFGNIEVDDVPYQMRCSGCGRGATLEIEMLLPSAADRQNMTIRKLDKVSYLRRVTWRDVSE